MALNLYNNPFNNFTQRNYVSQTPQNRLQNAYEKAMSNRTPEWARTVSDMMPSLAEIGAYFGTKGAFNQGRIADSLEREKQRRTAYNQMMRENEDKQVNDYVQLAKEQLGMDMALDDRERAKEEAQINRDIQENARKRAWEQMLWERDFKEKQAQQNQDNIDRNYNLQLKAIGSKPAELTPEEKIELKVKEENAVANAKAKREAEQDLNKALAGQQAFQSNLEHIKDLSKNAGNILDRSIGSVAGLFTGKDTSLTKANNSMDELVSQIRQAALTASGISGESDDKAQQAKLKDIYERAGVPMNAKSLTQAQVSSIINNIENIYRQRVAEKQNLVDSFKNDFSFSWRKK
ncbi:MAG: hypothetical protein J6S85_06410 [Methanobrevibacter sp.]|nr:hypothetical protein [Methanobrevibacter sp.]